jgi:osmotically-inducible protein OsmY
MKTIFSFAILTALISSSVYAAYPASNYSKVEAEKQGTTDSRDDSAMTIAQRLRARIMADNQLSTEAHNVQIVAQPTAITLKGKVANRAEKVKLENYARMMAGNKRVYNQLKY